MLYSKRTGYVRLLIVILLFMSLTTMAVADSFFKITLKIGTVAALTLFGLAEPTPAEEILEAAMISRLSGEIYCDPTPCRIVKNYQIEVKPRVPESIPRVDLSMLKKRFSGPVSETTVSLYQSVVDAECLLAAHETAVFETICRRYTARIKNDTEAEKIQEMYRQFIIDETARRRKESNQAWRVLLAHLKEKGITGNPFPDYQLFIDDLKKKGFPELELKIMHSFGMTDERIEEMRQVILDNLHPDFAPKSFEQTAEIIMLINEDNRDMEACDCLDLIILE